MLQKLQGGLFIGKMFLSILCVYKIVEIINKINLKLIKNFRKNQFSNYSYCVQRYKNLINL